MGDSLIQLQGHGPIQGVELSGAIEGDYPHSLLLIDENGLVIHENITSIELLDQGSDNKILTGKNQYNNLIIRNYVPHIGKLAMNKKSTVNTVFKAFSLIELLGAPNSKYSLTELSRELDISIGAVHRITNTLVQIGYLVKDEKTKKFSLTPKWLPLGFGILASLEIRKIALPYLKQLYKEIGETVSLVVRDGDDVIYIERLITQDLIGFNIRAGLRRPMYPNSMGKVILAFLPDDEKRSIISRYLSHNDNENELPTVTGIMKELNRIKVQGYAVNKVQYSGGALAISVPILNQQGQPIAGINIGFPLNSPPDEERFDELLKLLQNTGRAISVEIGYIDYMGE